MFFLLFFFNDTATTEIYTLSLHAALPISPSQSYAGHATGASNVMPTTDAPGVIRGRQATVSAFSEYAETWTACATSRSEEHTSELQSRQYLVCRLLLEKKK